MSPRFAFSVSSSGRCGRACLRATVRQLFGAPLDRDISLSRHHRPEAEAAFALVLGYEGKPERPQRRLRAPVVEVEAALQGRRAGLAVVNGVAVPITITVVTRLLQSRYIPSSIRRACVRGETPLGSGGSVSHHSSVAQSR